MYKYMIGHGRGFVRAVELFSGAGGMSRGLVDAGFEVVRAYDAWPAAVETYRRNIGPHVIEADLNDFSPSSRRYRHWHRISCAVALPARTIVWPADARRARMRL